ncbi:hypothetical protein [Aphanizomenon flos-aquae]|uniref:hypothetical protein n=1 Tax=Aphanizomenon flos-aquae TaxID=1176 RepID=UPI00048439D5|nr:hypothetical protein [Aphanizomenon flos-aquae]
MNPRLKLALIRHTGEEGFASVIAVGVGLVMMIIGLTMAIRSQGDVALGSAQKNTSRALSAAEVGVTRYQQLINNARTIARYNACSTATNYNSFGSCLDTTATTPVTWPIINQASDYNSCSFQNVDLAAITDASKNIWRNIDPATTNPDLTLGQYRLVSYQYQSNNISNPTANQVLGNGTLTVEGRVRVSGSGNTATTTTSTSTARLQVIIPVKYTDSNIPAPSALWTGNTPISTSANVNQNQQVDGPVLVNECTTNSNDISVITSKNILNPSDTKKVDKTLGLIPSPPPIPSTGVNIIATINTNGGIVTQLGNPNATSCSEAKTTCPSATPTTFGGQSGVYVYQIGDISSEINIPVGEKVVIFLTGSINKGTDITHNCTDQSNCFPSDLYIFGTGDSTKSICLNGNNTISAFILAPKYSVGVTGGGDADPVINGNVWASNWGVPNCDSGSNKTVVKQDPTITWGTLQGVGVSKAILPPTIDITSSWTKKQVQ